MKRFLIALVMVLMITSLFALSAYAVESTVYETELPEYTMPESGAVESQVVGTVNDLDKTLSGIQWWETAKTWILEHLSTVVGALMTLATFIIGLATKFSFIPKILNAFKMLFANVKTWYNSNIDELKSFREIIEGFIKNMTGVITEMKRQSDENNELRNELVAVRKEYISLQNRNNALETALFSATILEADQFAKLIQLSGLTKADADTLYETYLTRKKLITEALQATETPVIEGVSENV